MPSSVSSRSTRSSRSSGRSSMAEDCGCSEEAMAAWIIIPLITGIAMILALTLSHQEPFSMSARGQRESNYYGGYSNREDVAVVDTSIDHQQLNITMNSAVSIDGAAVNATWNATASDDLAKPSVVIREIVALPNID